MPNPRIIIEAGVFHGDDHFRYDVRIENPSIYGDDNTPDYIGCNTIDDIKRAIDRYMRILNNSMNTY